MPSSLKKKGNLPGDRLCNIRTANTRKTQKRQWETDCSGTATGEKKERMPDHIEQTSVFFPS